MHNSKQRNRGTDRHRSASTGRRTRRNSNAGTLKLLQRGSDSSASAAASDGIAPVRLRVINPKAISLQELFGQGDESTGEWEDGVLAVAMRACARDRSGDRKWILFDGPVDTLWIENMNTVLDDTKKLCLPNGQVIRVPEEVLMLFETDDLSSASPATVSRCGVVFTEPSIIGWRSLVASWLQLQQTGKGVPNGLVQAVAVL